ncbi:E3 ubiquitin-protein ligase RNF135-like isoform X2 [Silurus meridionalis]|uniref:E3 ubiquitin-protein ligase RNF135-like isoform X2 n=1 Tax=Silurus meridionalis TaxID=175797 RepID=UPI001EEA8892|nr:E3 ubiquitin-protein ligase RNF135-like isoform X2 [Silurus meridionalis]
MAHARVEEQDQFNCTICQEELKDPVTLPCGHNFCKACINGYWDQGVYVCSQCRQSFTPRLVLGTNEVLVDAMDKIKQTAIRAASAPRAESQNVSRSEDQSELKSSAKTMKLTLKKYQEVFAKMKAMAFNIYSILQKSIESQSQAPNAASTPQAAPAPEPSVVVKDDDEDNDEDDEDA